MSSLQPAATSAEAPNAPPTTWLTVAEAAALIKVSERTIYGAVAAGTLRHARVNRRRSLRFKPSWVEAYMTAENTPVEGSRDTPLRVAR